MPQRQVPLEVLGIIFSFICDDFSSLQSCAKVNTPFLETAYKHLYRNIHLNNLEGYRPHPSHKHLGYNKVIPAELKELLKAKPYIKSYVKNLWMVFAPIEVIRRSGKQPVDDNVIGEILRQLSQVRNVNLYSDEQSCTWSSFKLGFRDSFTQMISRPTLDGLCIGGIGHFPLSLLDYCPSLDNLGLENMKDLTLSTSKLPAENPPTKRTKNTDLRILGLHTPLLQILDWLRIGSTFSPQHLVSLNICVVPDNLHLVQAILNLCSSQLEFVMISANMPTLYNANHDVIFPSESNPLPVLDFSAITSLWFLCIEDKVESIDSRRPGPQHPISNALSQAAFSTSIPWITQVVSTFGSSDTPNGLTNLQLNINFGVDEFYMEMIDWEPLTTVLKSEYFSSLEKVELHAYSSGLRCTLPESTLRLRLESNFYLSSLVEIELLSFVYE